MRAPLLSLCSSSAVLKCPWQILWNTKRIMDIYAEDLEDAVDPEDGADPEEVRRLARDLGTLYPCSASFASDSSLC